VGLGPDPDRQPPAHNSLLRPWLAATLSICCGLGQLYNGQIAKGMILMILATAALVSLSLRLGKLLALVVWSYAIIDAFVVARRTTGATSCHGS
jgi:TM2 domain-containing membrane protein YozV